MNESNADPDVLVLGFEELDLSTEALLYSTSTVREDAWTAAIFAALGEKSEIYEKVSILDHSRLAYIEYPREARLEATGWHADHHHCQEVFDSVFLRYPIFYCWSRHNGTDGMSIERQHWKKKH